jgi:uncharacterized protein YaaN involved in tellurite resistance
MTNGTAVAPLHLSLDVPQVKQEVVVAPATPADAALEQKAQSYADRLAAIRLDDAAAQSEGKAAVEQMGRELQRDSAHRSKMLQQPIQALSERGADGGPVANALVDLKVQVESLDPNKFDFEPGWGSRIVGMLPGVGTPLKRYFSRYESAQTVIDAIIRSLENGREQLKRDNITLADDQAEMRALTEKLAQQVALGQRVDQKLEAKAARELAGDEVRTKFVQEELLFPLRQRIMDLQQQLAVNQQGVLSLALIMRNNEELMRGVNRAIDVTVSALQVAVTAALALANQKVVLDKITALNATTNELIAGTAQRLRTQGTAIHTQASSAMLDMAALKSAFADINAAMDEIARYRREALPQMANTILEFDKLAAEGEQAIRKYEEGERARPTLQIGAE